MIRSKAFILAAIAEFVLIFTATRVSLSRLSARSRALAWIGSVWTAAGILEARSMCANQSRWIHVPPFFGIDSCAIACVACIIISTAIIERALLRINVLQGGELPIMGAALALPMAYLSGETVFQVAVLSFLASSVAAMIAVHYSFVCSPLCLPAPHEENETPIGRMGDESLAAFVAGDRVLVALISVNVAVFFGLVVAPQLSPTIGSILAEGIGGLS